MTQFRWWHEANLWNALGAALKARRRELCFCGSHHRKPTQAKAVLPNGVCCVQRNYPNGKSQLAHVLPVPSDPLRATRPGTTHEETARTHTSVLIIFQDQLFSTDQFRRTILESLSRLTSVARSAYVRQQETHTVNGPQRAREVPKRRSSNRTLCSVFLFFFIGSSQKKQVPASTPMMRNSLSVPSEVCDDETLNLVNLRRPRRVLLLLGGCILVFGF